MIGCHGDGFFSMGTQMGAIKLMMTGTELLILYS